MFLPLRDKNPRSTTPVVTVLLIVANTLVFLYQITLPAKVEQRFLAEFALTPAIFFHTLGAPGIPLQSALMPLITCMFLHGGWLHLLGNMWFLWVFGDNVEDRLGHLAYIWFYLLCGLGAGVLHLLLNANSKLPTLGASGAISGVLGAYLILFPRARVLTLVFLVFFIFTVELPAVLVLGWWFVIQFLSGLESLGMRSAGGVAWWAHIGGFVLGVMLIKIWPQRGRRYAAYS